MLGYDVQIVSKAPRETIESFSASLPTRISTIGGIECVEVPETLATSRYLPSDAPLHIRLHCSRSLGAMLEGRRFSRADVELEQGEITRARWVSAPSVAAVEASRLLFTLPKEFIVYANPAPAYQPEDISPDIDAIFVGRWHRLKGIEYLQRLRVELPSRSFGIVTQSRGAHFKQGMTVLQARSLAEKRRAMSRARVVIVPSLFETASMVGLEALSVARPVITWSHIGLAEYCNPPGVVTVAPFDTRSLALKLNSLLATTDERDFSDCIARVNCGYDSGVQDLLHFDAKRSPYGLVDASPIEIHRGLRKLKKMDLQIRRPRRGTFSAKMLKLVKDPKAYWEDSRMRRSLSEFSHGKPWSFLVSHDKRTGGCENFVSIKRGVRIQYVDPVDRPKGMVTAILYPDSHPSDLVRSLMSKMDEFSDFPYLTHSRRYVGTFEYGGVGCSLDVLNRTDRKQKQRISKISNIVLVDAPPSLCEALRSCGTSQRIILLVTELYDGPCPDPRYVDVLIVPRAIENIMDDVLFRRRIVISAIPDAPAAIRRAIQEGSPRKRDMLLPLINFDEYQAGSLLNFDSRRFQAVVRLKAGTVPHGQTMRELCQDFSQRIDSMAILESIYMRYRTLCEMIERGGDPSVLVEFLLYDGMLIDVQYS